MTRLEERLQMAAQTLRTLEEVTVHDTPTTVVRDAALQRFEYTLEAMWKAAQLYLREAEGLASGSPKGVIRACGQVGLLSEAQVRQALQMVDDRNLTVHPYNEELARAVYRRVREYVPLLRRWLRALEQRAS